VYTAGVPVFSLSFIFFSMFWSRDVREVWLSSLWYLFASLFYIRMLELIKVSKYKLITSRTFGRPSDSWLVGERKSAKLTAWVLSHWTNIMPVSPLTPTTLLRHESIQPVTAVSTSSPSGACLWSWINSMLQPPDWTNYRHGFFVWVLQFSTNHWRVSWTCP